MISKVRSGFTWLIVSRHDRMKLVCRTWYLEHRGQCWVKLLNNLQRYNEISKRQEGLGNSAVYFFVLMFVYMFVDIRLLELREFDTRRRTC